ncbi:MAG: MarR family winged helix-turn-helix transcriptional regulator [Actinomycetota bacterium]
MSFLLAKLGQVATGLYTAKLAPYGVKPKHVGLLALLSSETGDFQLELSRRLRVAPSLVVAMADELEDLGAVTRLRDPEDRRKSALVVTPVGRHLLKKCHQALKQVDDELLATVRHADRKTQSRVLGGLLASLADNAPPRS